MKYVTCEECGCVMDKEILKKKDALRYYLWFGKARCKFICQNCGIENRPDDK